MSYELALFLHLLGVVLFFSGTAVAAVALAAARRRARAGEIALLLRLTRWGVLLVGGGAVLLLGFGFWLVELTRWTLGDAWLGWALALFVVAAVLGAVGGRRPKRARLLAERLPADVDAPEELRSLLRDPVSDLLNWGAAVAAFAVLALMVWKP
ncbi:MAG: DUF2269 family protein [Gaiellaceae bacterium]